MVENQLNEQLEGDYEMTNRTKKTFVILSIVALALAVYAGSALAHDDTSGRDGNYGQGYGSGF